VYLSGVWLMRDYLILGIIIGSLPFCFLRPFWGILMWTWVSLMNPHRLGWSTAYNFPVAQFVAVAVLLGLPFSKERRSVPIFFETILYFLLWIFFTVSSIFAIYPDESWSQWQQVTKILLMSLLPVMVITDRKRLRYFLLTIALSVGFYGAKGGLFSLATAGAFRVWGPPESFFHDNNDLALALNMVLPILFYLAKEEDRRKVKVSLYIVFFLSVLGVLFTYSRGGLVGLGVITVVYLLRSKKRSIGIAILIIAVFIFISVVPQKWLERMESVRDYSQGEALDASAAGRINAWHFGWNLAVDRPLTGGGFGAFSKELFLRYAPNPDDFHDAHSIYFEMLAEQGFIAFGLFLGILFSCYRSLSKIKADARRTNLGWLAKYADMIQLSLLAYVFNGAFLGRAYFDLFYQIVVVVIIMKLEARKALSMLSEEQKCEFGDHPAMPLAQAL
jgi:putative inorganic carbon (hco3(-)) transporter